MANDNQPKGPACPYEKATQKPVLPEKVSYQNYIKHPARSKAAKKAPLRRKYKPAVVSSYMNFPAYSKPAYHTPSIRRRPVSNRYYTTTTPATCTYGHVHSEPVTYPPAPEPLTYQPIPAEPSVVIVNDPPVEVTYTSSEPITYLPETSSYSEPGPTTANYKTVVGYSLSNSKPCDDQPNSYQPTVIVTAAPYQPPQEATPELVPETSYEPPVTEPPRSYTEPAPAYTEPAPVYTEPAPVYTEPAPVYTEPTPIYTEPTPIYTEPTPVYTEPSPAPVIEEKAPCDDKTDVSKPTYPLIPYPASYGIPITVPLSSYPSLSNNCASCYGRQQHQPVVMLLPMWFYPTLTSPYHQLPILPASYASQVPYDNKPYQNYPTEPVQSNPTTEPINYQTNENPITQSSYEIENPITSSYEIENPITTSSYEVENPITDPVSYDAESSTVPITSEPISLDVEVTKEVSTGDGIIDSGDSNDQEETRPVSETLFYPYKDKDIAANTALGYWPYLPRLEEFSKK